MRPNITHYVPTSATLRQLIDEVLLDDVDFDAFCHDYFPEIYHRFTVGMQHQQKVTILLHTAHRREVLERLCLRFPERSDAERWHDRLEWEEIDVNAIPLMRKKRRRSLQNMLLGAALGDWLRRIWVGLSPELKMIAFGALLMLLSGYGITILTNVPRPLTNRVGPRGGRTLITNEFPPDVPGLLFENQRPITVPDGGALSHMHSNWREPALPGSSP